MTPDADVAAALLRALPGAVLGVAPDGTVTYSNGRLDAELGRGLAGVAFADVLDAASSRQKWERLLASAIGGAPGAPEPAAPAAWELVLVRGDTLLEPRAFAVVRPARGEGLWLVEHRRDPRLGALNEQLLDMNSELVNTQRDLAKERARLSQALAALETQHRETERLNAELERSNQALDEFAHVVSHDLKAPLRNIVDFAGWIEADLAPHLTGETAEHMALLRERARHLQAMVDGVLRYARTGRHRAPPEEVDVGALVRGVTDLLDAPGDAVIEVDDALPTLRTARAPLEQVFLNLIGNALKHARRDDARVRVWGRPAGEFHEFAVADNGPGIPPEARERIWQLFHTLQPRDDVDGTGIGLAVVRRAVEAEGGRVWVESGDGGGAVFRFLWPAGAGTAR